MFPALVSLQRQNVNSQLLVFVREQYPHFRWKNIKKEKSTYDFLWDWLIVMGVEGDDGVTGPKAELLEMSSASSASPTICPSSSTIPWTQPPEHGQMKLQLQMSCLVVDRQ